MHITSGISRTSGRSTIMGIIIRIGVTVEDKERTGQVKVATRAVELKATNDTAARHERSTVTWEEKVTTAATMVVTTAEAEDTLS